MADEFIKEYLFSLIVCCFTPIANMFHQLIDVTIPGEGLYRATYAVKRYAVNRYGVSIYSPCRGCIRRRGSRNFSKGGGGVEDENFENVC